MNQRIIVLCVMLFLSGCTGLTSCIDSDELAQAGVCADPFYIEKNIENIDKISYPNLVYKDGKYFEKGSSELEDYEAAQRGEN